MYQLKRSWTLYFHSKDKNKSYDSNTIKLMTISDIETFWKTVNNVPTPEQIFSDGNLSTRLKISGTEYVPNAFSFFEQGVKPTWDDKANVYGAELSIRRFKGLQEISYMWVTALVDLIGENNDISHHIKGIRVVDSTLPNRPMYRIEFWYDNKSVTDKIREHINSLFNIKSQLLYREHSNITES